jgi:hypothetical protein
VEQLRGKMAGKNGGEKMAEKNTCPEQLESQHTPS